MNDNLVSMEIAIDASLFVGLEAAAKEKGGLSAGQRLSSFLPVWIASILERRENGVQAKRRVA